jgi:hypothetical protein
MTLEVSQIHNLLTIRYHLSFCLSARLRIHRSGLPQGYDSDHEHSHHHGFDALEGARIAVAAVSAGVEAVDGSGIFPKAASSTLSFRSHPGAHRRTKSHSRASGKDRVTSTSSF